MRISVVGPLVCLALVAGACGGDDLAEPSAGGSAIDDLLGTQAVQDFTIHFGIWTLDDDDALVDVYAPLLEHVTQRADEPIDLAGGFTFAPVDGLDARMVDEGGGELPTLSVDFGLLAPTTSAVDTTRSAFLSSPLSDLGDELASPLSGPAHAEPFLVEIVSADFSAARVHVGLDDRSEIDLTFIDALRPGAEVAMLTLFGQTLPGDPLAEQGLDPFELFVHRWNDGLIQVVGGGGSPEPFLDSDVDVTEGSTILSRRDKRQAGLLAGHSAAREAAGEIVAEIRAAQSDAIDAVAEGGSTGESAVSDLGLKVSYERVGETSGRTSFTFIRDGRANFTTNNQWKAWAYARLLLALKVCAVVATALVAQNEAGRAPGVRVDRSSTLRPVDGGGSQPVGSTVPPEGPEPEGQPALSCGDPPDFENPPPVGGIHGDVRIMTIDGIAYAQQAVGEFLVFENDTTVIQMRAEPAGDSDRLSIATAFAVGTGGESISMHGGGRTYVDGERRDLDRGERVRVGEAEVLWGYFGWTIAWPDGQLVEVFDRGDANGMTLTVKPGSGDAVGQLGDGDGDPANDFATRDGDPLQLTVVDDLETFYATYVDSWRLTQDESLLHYDDGETTESFRIDGFPSTALTVDVLDPLARGESEEACRAAGIVDERLYGGCVIDVAATGDPGYAFDAFRVQLVTAPPQESGPGSEPDGEATPDVPAGTPGDTVFTIANLALVFGEDPPNQRVGGVAPSWDCEITDGNLFAEGSIDLAEGPRYAISVQHFGSEPRFSLIVKRDGVDHAWVLTNAAHFTDAVDDATLDGDRLIASGEIYVNDPPQPGLAPFSALPADATLDPFTLDLDCHT